MIAILSALAAERDAVLAALEVAQVVRKDSFRVFTCRTSGDGGAEVLVAATGIGKVSAAARTQAVISEFGATGVIFSGVAGGIGEGVQVGDLVIATDTVQHDFDCTVFGYQPGEVPPPGSLAVVSEPGYVQAARRASGRCRWEALPDGRLPAVHEGRVLTGDQFVCSDETAIRLGQSFGGLSVDMESAAVAQVCAWNEVPFLIIRSFSDTARGDAPAAFRGMSGLAARNAAKLALGTFRELALSQIQENHESGGVL